MKEQEIQVRCTCIACQRERFWQDVRTALGVIVWALFVVVGLVDLCIVLTGCSSVPVSECEYGYSWRGDCNQQLFQE